MKHRFLLGLGFVLLTITVFICLASCGNPIETTDPSTTVSQMTTTAPITTVPPITTSPMTDLWQNKIPDFAESGKEEALSRAAKTPDGALMTVVTFGDQQATADTIKAFLKQHSLKGHFYGIEKIEGTIVYLDESTLEKIAKLPEISEIDILTESDDLAWMRKVQVFYRDCLDESALYASSFTEQLAYTDSGKLRVIAIISDTLSEEQTASVIDRFDFDGKAFTYLNQPAIEFFCNGIEDLKSLGNCPEILTIDFNYLLLPA